MDIINDGYERYYSEKIWQMIPPYYRDEDGLAANPGVLRALIEIIASQAAHVRRSQDRVWEDQFIELCQDWAVPYIGALVATRMLPAVNRRGSRVDVAKTIYYRRRKGTTVVLEELITDVTGWSGKLVETFRYLGRSWHRLDPPLSNRGTTLSGTPAGGFAELRRPEAALLTGGPFNEFHHTPDIRRPLGVQGRPNIPTLAFHLYPLAVHELSNVFPKKQGSDRRFTFDPSGRDVPLFMPGADTFDWANWRSPRAWEVPAPMTCTLINHAEFELGEKQILQAWDDYGLSDDQVKELRTLSGLRYRREPDFYRALEQLPSVTVSLTASVYQGLYDVALVPDCARNGLISDAVEVHRTKDQAVPRTAVIGGDLSVWSPRAVLNKELMIDPQRGRFQFLTGTGTVGETHCRYHYGFSLGIGAGGHARDHVEAIEADGDPLEGGGRIHYDRLFNDGVAEIKDSATYSPVSDKRDVKNLRVQSANGQRPYCLMKTNWVLNTGTNTDATVALDGLWLGAKSDQKLILRGDFETVHLAHMTLDPGGARNDEEMVPSINPVVLSVQGHIETLVIEKSILGRIDISGPGHVEKLMLSDSILQAPSIADMVLATTGDLIAKRVTIIGGVRAQHLEVGDSILVGEVNALNPQTGCVRFSALPISNNLPHPYECFYLSAGMQLFHSTRFGDPGYCRLRDSLDREILEGAEEGLEMGAFNLALRPVKLESLTIKIEEYMPFGRLPALIMEL